MTPIKTRISHFVIIAALAAPITLTGCSFLKNTGRTINDAASILCNLFATEHPEEIQGLTPAEWCAVHDNIAPFIDEALRAKQSAGTMAVSRESE